VKREVGIPIKSVPSFPLVNLPVGTWLTKSLPYGGKLLLKAESMKLLFPGSTVESPNTYIADTCFLEPSMVATKHDNKSSRRSLEVCIMMAMLMRNEGGTRRKNS